MLGSNTVEIPFTPSYFGRLVSTPVDSPREALREGLRVRGYVLMRGALDVARVRCLRSAYLAHFPASMFTTGMVGDEGNFSGIYPNDLPPHGTPGHPAHAFVRSETFRAFVSVPQLQALADTLLGCPTVRLRRTPLRHFVRGRAVASRAHIDYSYLDAGSTDIVTFCIPIGHLPPAASYILKTLPPSTLMLYGQACRPTASTTPDR